MNKDEKEPKLQYHSPFCCAMELELRKDRKNLDFRPEETLNTMPNTVDLLITKKNAEEKVSSGLGAAFRKYNILEYKSPQNAMGERVFHRTLAYAHLFIAYNKDQIEASELAVVFIREFMPRTLVGCLKKWGYEIVENEPGIYHAVREKSFFVQVVVTRKLSGRYRWITRLTDRLGEEDLKAASQDMMGFTDAKDMLNAESVFRLMMELLSRKIGKERVEELMEEFEFKGLFTESQRAELLAHIRETEELEEKLEQKERQIQLQEEAMRRNAEELKQKDEAMKQKDEAMKQKDEAMRQKDEAMRRKDEAMRRKDEAMRQKDEAMRQKDEENRRLREMLRDMGMATV